MASATGVHSRCGLPELPLWMKRRLNKSFPGWKFPDVSEEDCQTVKDWGGPDANPYVIRGDFDGNGELDYALLIARCELTDDHCLTSPAKIYIVAFLRKPERYKLQVVTRDGGAAACN